MIKRALFIILSLTIMISLTPDRAATRIIDRIIAVVNDDIITLSELKEARSALIDQMGTEFLGEIDKSNADSEILDRMIESKLIHQAAERMGIHVSEIEVDRAIEDVKKRNNIDQSTLIQALSANNMTYQDYREKMRNDITEVKFIDKVIKSKVTISDDEIFSYYNRNKDRFTDPPEVRLRQILLLVPREASDVEKKEIYKRALAVLEEIKRGADFSTLASRYSDGPNASNGGDLGFVKMGEIDPALEKVAFRLDIGEVSPVITTSNGFHILLVTDKRKGRQKPLSEVKEEIQSIIFKDKEKEAFNDWLEDMKKLSYIEVRL